MYNNLVINNVNWCKNKKWSVLRRPLIIYKISLCNIIYFLQLFLQDQFQKLIFD